MSTVSITTFDELSRFSESLLLELAATTDARATVLGLDGDLGAGKTALVQQLAKHLGVVEGVTSPTYIIMRSYATTHPQFHTLVHIDAYRIESLAELIPLRFAEVLTSPHTLVCIEWASQIKAALPLEAFFYTLVAQMDGTRTVTRCDAEFLEDGEVAG